VEVGDDDGVRALLMRLSCGEGVSLELVEEKTTFFWRKEEFVAMSNLSKYHNKQYRPQTIYTNAQ